MKESIKFLFPDFKKKAIILSYDDGVEDDVFLIELLNKYHLKGTFNLNSEYLKTQFEWVHESGAIIKRNSIEKANEIYKSPHEIASHSLTHPYMDYFSKEEIYRELKEDKDNLEKIFNIEIKGYATPFHFYSDLVKEVAKEVGFSYVRTSYCSHDLTYPNDDAFEIKSTVFHLEDDFEGYMETFLNEKEATSYMFLIGHSYDLRVNNMFPIMEKYFERIASDNDIISLTTYEFISYISALKEAVFLDDRIINKSKTNDIYLIYQNKPIIIKKNSEFLI